jgi:lipoprotein signal peptidase
MTRLGILVAGTVVAATLVHDALVPSRLSHPRPLPLLVAALVVAAALLVLAPRARSIPLTVGAGIAAGGALATAIAGVAWQGGVPNPLAGGGIAFNVADVAIAVGDALMIAAALVRAWTQRATLSAPI